MVIDGDSSESGILGSGDGHTGGRSRHHRHVAHAQSAVERGAQPQRKAGADRPGGDVVAGHGRGVAHRHVEELAVGGSRQLAALEAHQHLVLLDSSHSHRTDHRARGRIDGDNAVRKEASCLRHARKEAVGPGIVDQVLGRHLDRTNRGGAQSGDAQQSGRAQGQTDKQRTRKLHGWFSLRKNGGLNGSNPRLGRRVSAG